MISKESKKKLKDMAGIHKHNRVSMIDCKLENQIWVHLLNPVVITQASPNWLRLQQDTLKNVFG